MPMVRVRCFACVACLLLGCRSSPAPRSPAEPPGTHVFVEAVLVDVPADVLAPQPRTPADAQRLGAARGRSSAAILIFGGVPDASDPKADHRPPLPANAALDACERYDLVPQRVAGARVDIELTFHAPRLERRTTTMVATEGQLSAIEVAGGAAGHRRTLYVRTTYLRSLGNLHDMFERAHREAGGDPSGFPTQSVFGPPSGPTLLVDPSCGRS